MKYHFENLPKNGWCVDIVTEANHPRIEEFKKIWTENFAKSYRDGIEPIYQYCGIEIDGCWNSVSKEHIESRYSNNIITLDQFFEMVERKETKSDKWGAIEILEPAKSDKWVPVKGEEVLVRNSGREEWYKRVFVVENRGCYYCETNMQDGLLVKWEQIKQLDNLDPLKPELDQLISKYAELGIKLIPTFESI